MRRRPHSRLARLFLQALEDRLTPTNYTVTNLNDNGAGSLRQAIINANGNPGADTIVFDGTLLGTITLTTGQLAITDAVTINGPGVGQVNINGNGVTRIFDTSGATTGAVIKISDLAIRNASASAINITHQAVTLTNVNIANSTSTANGGAIIGGDNSLTLNNCILSGNSSASRGGAVYMPASATLIVQDSWISGNTAGVNGGGIYFEAGGSLNMDRTTVSGNATTGGFTGGGGIYFWGIVSAGGFNIRNSTISGNSTSVNGGGLVLSTFSGTATIQNSTIFGNTAHVFGGGIALFSGGLGTLSLESSVVSNNQNAVYPDIYSTTAVGSKSSLIGNAAGFSRTDNGGNLAYGTDPQLGPLADNVGTGWTHLPAMTSPLRNVGTNPTGATLDGRGKPRSVGTIDIGAVEVQTLNGYVVTNTNDTGAGSLRQAILNANGSPGLDQISFDPTVFNASPTAKTITLASTLSITDAVDIVGPGAQQVNVSGNNLVQIFNTTSAPASAAITISGLTLTAASAGSGPAMVMTSQAVTVQNCAITANSAVNGSGILLNGTGALVVRGTTISGNKGGAGGAIDVFPGGGSLLVENCTLSGNTAGVSGGAIYSGGTIPAAGIIIRNTTITANSSPNGGGIFRTGAGAVTLLNDIVSGNSGTTGPDINAITGTVTANFTAIGVQTGYTLTAGAGIGNLPAAAALNLGALANNGGSTQSRLPGSGSAAINAGLYYSPLPTDQRGLGFPRNVGNPDMGAIETLGGPTSLTVTNRLDSGPGSLRQAVSDANAVAATNDTIRFYPNIVGTITLTGGEMAVSDATTIVGPGSGLLTVSGNNASRIFNINGGTTLTSTISGLTLANGKSASYGGAIFASQSLTLSDVTISGNNSSISGGGVFVISANLTASDCTFTGNMASSVGGGIDRTGDTSKTVTLTRCTVSGNSSGYDSGGALLYGVVLIDSCTISGNTSTGSIYGGGGIIAVIDGGSLTIRNSTLSGNSSAGSGGGIDIFGSSYTAPVQIQNCTIAGNSSSASGGGIGRQGGTTTNIAIDSSVVSGNSAPSGPDISIPSSVNVNFSAIGKTTGFTLNGANNLPFGANLKLGPLAFNGGTTQTMMPAIDSPLRGQGSNAGAAFPTDQRGFPRVINGGIDIGSVEVGTTSVVSIARNDPNPTTAGTVSWNVTLADSLTGVNASDFTLSGTGLSGATITNVTGGGSTYAVTAATGVDGTLALNFVNTNNLSLLPNNLPFAGSAYTVDKVAPVVVSFTSNLVLVTDAQVGPSRLSFTAIYSKPMDTTSTPVISFPTAGENPGGSFVLASGSWTNSTTYVANYNVNDLNMSIPGIDTKISGGVDTGGTAFGSLTINNLLGLDTQNPVITGISRNDPLDNKLATVHWNVTFSEPVSNVLPGIFTLYNGGLGGTPAITGVTGGPITWTVAASTGGSGVGNLGLLAVSSGSVTDGAGNPLAALPVSGPEYYVDFVSPAASKLTLNTLIVSDANVGSNGFVATLKYNELMDQTVNPTVSFPVENPGGTLTFAGGSWLDAQTYQARYNVADLNVTSPNIDMRFTGGQDLVGNVQTQFDAPDVFSIDTQNPVVSSITSATPNGTYGVGANIDVTLNFSEQVNLVGTLNVTLDTGAVVSIVGPASGTSLTGTYTVAAGQNSGDLNVTGLALSGSSTLKDNATNNAVLNLPASNLANNANIVVSTAGVTGFTVNGGAAQRSRLTTILVNFASPVNAATLQAAGVITLTRTTATSSGTVGTVVNTSNGLIVSPATGSVTSVTLTFANIVNSGVENLSLADGRWRLAIPSLGYQSGLNDPALRRLFGDSNNDGTVDGTDFGQFGSVFGQTLANSPFDDNADGTVDGTDFAQFGARFGITL